VGSVLTGNPNIYQGTANVVNNPSQPQVTTYPLIINKNNWIPETIVYIEALTNGLVRSYKKIIIEICGKETVQAK
jgi:hypothetical protein